MAASGWVETMSEMHPRATTRFWLVLLLGLAGSLIGMAAVIGPCRGGDPAVYCPALL